MRTSQIMTTLLVVFSLVFGMQAQAANMPDKNITTDVKSRIAKQPKLQAFEIDVLTKQGIVTLTGVVDTEDQAGLLIEQVQAANGVKDVNTSKLKVNNSGNALSDTFITAKVKGKFIEQALLGDEEIEAMEIHVKTTNGIVELTGDTDSKEKAKLAESLAKSVDGVKKVDSKIIVNQ